MKSNLLVVILVLGVAGSFAPRAFAKGHGSGGQQGGNSQGGAAAVATVTKGETPGQLLRDAARDKRIVADLAQISSGLRSTAAASITSAATVAGYVDMIGTALTTEANADTTLAQQLLAAGTQRSPGLNKAQLTTQATTDAANAKTLSDAASILKQVVAAQKAAQSTSIGVFEKLSNSARRLSTELSHEAAEATREASRLK